MENVHLKLDADSKNLAKSLSFFTNRFKTMLN